MNLLAMCKELRELTGHKDFGTGTVVERRHRTITFRPVNRKGIKMYRYRRDGYDNYGYVNLRVLLAVLRQEQFRAQVDAGCSYQLVDVCDYCNKCGKEEAE